ncbi:hypothetical protein OEZ85_009533 [Tetradesmus obliquus]|uniref:Dilute domain-containing protein n=1 Tax=Tetradesmus obliquus TaxID=3088 RepID=A0ABY8UC58_TETOB|nr:hypothetical protein OEZ85_009533 [Tetradesmus obliquus]
MLEVHSGRDRLVQQLQLQLDSLHWRQQQLLHENSALRCSVEGRALEPEQQSSIDAACLGPTPQQLACSAKQHLDPLLNGTHSALQQQLQELCCPSVADLLRMLPLSALAPIAVDKGMHRRIMKLTPQAAAQHWSQAVKDLQMLLYLHARSPAASCHEMSVMVHELLRWSCAVYMFNPAVLQELRDVNMATMQHQPPPAEHWRNGWQAAALSEAQRKQICAVRDFTCARLEALDAERRQLQEEQATLHAAAAAAAAAQQGAAFGDSSSSDRASNGGSGDSSSRNSGLIERQRWEVAQQLARVNSAWRMLTQLRSQFVVMVLQPVQAARIVYAIYPYMLLGGPFYQHLGDDGGFEAQGAAAACSGCYGGVDDGHSSGNNAADASNSAEADTSSSEDSKSPLLYQEEAEGLLVVMQN